MMKLRDMRDVWWLLCLFTVTKVLLDTYERDDYSHFIQANLPRRVDIITFERLVGFLSRRGSNQRILSRQSMSCRRCRLHARSG